MAILLLNVFCAVACLALIVLIYGIFIILLLEMLFLRCGSRNRTLRNFQITLTDIGQYQYNFWDLG